MQKEATDRNVVAEPDLTAAQRETLRLLSEHNEAILKDFDAVLARYGIHKQVFDFRLGERSAEDFPPFWECCACPPPENAPAGMCHVCPPPDAGAPPPPSS